MPIGNSSPKPRILFQLDPALRKQYLKTRSQLLSQKYGVNFDSSGSRKSFSHRSSSQMTLEVSIFK